MSAYLYSAGELEAPWLTQLSRSKLGQNFPRVAVAHARETTCVALEDYKSLAQLQTCTQLEKFDVLGLRVYP